MTGADVARAAPRLRGRALARFLWEMRSDALTPLVEVVRAHGDSVQSSIPGLRSQAIYRAEHVERVLVTNQDNYRKGPDYDLFALVLGRGLVTSSGELWRRQRRLIQPMFAKRHLEPFADHMTAAGARLLDDWETRDGARVDVSAAMMELTLDVVGRALFGTDLTGASTRTIGAAVTELVTEISEAGRSPLIWGAQSLPGMTMERAMRLRPLRRRRLRRRVGELDRLVHSMIAERRARPAGEDADLLQLLLDARDDDTGQPMSDRQVRDEVVTFLSAGHETTANALAWTWWLLARHPGARERLYAEVDSVLGGRVPVFADADRLPWTRAALQEALRLYPPVWIMLRWAEEDDVLGDVRVEAGTTVFVLVYLTHRDPEAWPDPERFDPARFLPEAARERPRHAYIPFSTGRRGCVGSMFALTEATLLTAMIAQRYVLELEHDRPVSPEAVLTLRPHGGMPMRLKKR